MTRTMRRTAVVLMLAVGMLWGMSSNAGAASPLNPVGSLDRIVYDGSLKVGGWAFDPETSASINVHAYLDGQLRAVATADQTRFDVAAAYPAYGAAHGWSFDLGKVGGGVHTVCVYAINVGIGDTNPALGCRSFTVTGNRALNPVGGLDQVAIIPTGVYLAGWSFDPETSAAIDVHAYVDGVFAGAVRADRARYDVAAKYPSYGPGHGYEMLVETPEPGTHTVCVYAINVGDGTTNPSLGCRTFTVDHFSFGMGVQWEDGVEMAVGQPQRVTVSKFASPAPSAGYTGVLFSVQIYNGSATTFDPYWANFVLTTGSAGHVATMTFDSGGVDPDNDFSGNIPSGAAQTITVLFQVPTAEANYLRLEVTPDRFDYLPAYFVGAV